MKIEAHVDHPLIDGINNEWKQISSHKTDPSSKKLDKVKDKSGDFSFEELTEELESVALEWKSVRAANECPCSTPLDFASFKVPSGLIGANYVCVHVTCVY